MSIVDVSSMPDAVWLAMPFDKRWGYDFDTHFNSGKEIPGIKIQVRPEEAARYVTPDDIILAHWEHQRAIMLGFCSAGFNWREFSQLVRAIGIGNFAAGLDGIVDYCSERKRADEKAFVGLFTVLRSNLVSISTRSYDDGVAVGEREEIELAYLSVLLFPTEDYGADEIDFTLSMHEKHSVADIARVVLSGVPTEHIMSVMDNDLDLEMTTRLLETV